MAENTAQQAGSTGTQRTESTTSTGREEQISPHAGSLQEYMNSAVEQTGKILKTMSQKVRSLAESVRDEPGTKSRVRRTAERVAQRLESSAHYLEGNDAPAVQRELASVVQRYPLRTVGVCLGVGLLVGSAMRRRGI
jgi:hypothetical protein